MYTQKAAGGEPRIADARPLASAAGSGEVGGKLTPEPKTAQPAVVTKPPPAAPTPSKGAFAVPRSVSSLISATGLPADKLSASIISFARFFSLPIKPELMADIRRQALSPKMTLPAEIIANSREAFSLVASAAQDKGVEFYPKGLEAYVEAIDPDQRNSGGHHSHGQQQKQEQDGQKEEGVVPDKEMILESAEKDPLLALLNKLPGKNGQRWMVFPFTLNESGKELKVSLRILLAGENIQHMVLDIVEKAQNQRDKTERRWVFVPAGNTSELTGISMLTLYLQPELPPKARAILAHRLSQAMEIPPDCITVNNLAEPFPCESGSGNELLRAINEAV